MNYIFLNKNNRVCYRKYLVGFGIKFWFMDDKESLENQISCASYPNYQLAHPEFVPWRHGWNLYGSAGSVDLPQSSLLHFTHFDPAFDVFWKMWQKRTFIGFISKTYFFLFDLFINICTLLISNIIYEALFSSMYI